jgi:hypothetical protein
MIALYNLLTYALFIVLPSFLIAFFLGTKRQIGLGWSLFIGLFLTPLVSLMMTLLSRSAEQPPPTICLQQGHRFFDYSLLYFLFDK